MASLTLSYDHEDLCEPRARYVADNGEILTVLTGYEKGAVDIIINDGDVAAIFGIQTDLLLDIIEHMEDGPIKEDES